MSTNGRYASWRDKLVAELEAQINEASRDSRDFGIDMLMSNILQLSEDIGYYDAKVEQTRGRAKEKNLLWKWARKEMVEILNDEIEDRLRRFYRGS